MKRLLIGSIAVAGGVALLSLTDMILGFPFGRFSMMMDILFLVSALIVGYMGWDSLRELR